MFSFIKAVKKLGEHSTIDKRLLFFQQKVLIFCFFCMKTYVMIVLGFNNTSTLAGHFVSSPRKREKRDRRDSRGDEREG